jgi:archaellum component FlaF (FlaF/FlaG flagellin family)
MRPIRVSVSSATTSQVIPLDQYISPFNVSIGVALSAGASLTYKIQHTFDDVFSTSFNPATATWFDHATLVSKTASSDGNYAFPVSAIRINVTPYTSGTATLNVMQAGITT